MKAEAVLKKSSTPTDTSQHHPHSWTNVCAREYFAGVPVEQIADVMSDGLLVRSVVIFIPSQWRTFNAVCAEAVIRCGRKLGEVAEETNDQATIDLIGRRLGSHEKMAWMLRSHL